MSNPEFAREKNQLVQVNEDGSFHDEFSLNDVDFGSDGVARVPRYLSLARDAALAGIDAIVIGAPSSNNHISRSEIARVRSYAPTQRVLVPGVGKQGGDAASLWAIYGANDVIVNVGTALMFPQGKSRDRVAEQYCLELNAARHVSLGR